MNKNDNINKHNAMKHSDTNDINVINFFNFFKQKKNASFTLFMYVRILVVSMLSYSLIMPYTMSFLHLRRYEIIATLIILVIVFNVIQFVAVPIFNWYLTHPISNTIRFWRISTFNEKMRTKLYKQIMGYPIKKSVTTYIYFLISLLFFCEILRRLFHVDIYLMLMLFISLQFFGYFVMLGTFHVTEYICSSIAMRLINEGISEKEILHKKFFGISIHTLFIMYIVLPIVLSGVLLYLLVFVGTVPVTMHGENGIFATAVLTEIELMGGYISGYIPRNMQVSHLIFSLIVSFLFVGISAWMFYQRATRYSTQMNETLISIDMEDIGTTNIFPVDLSSEFSYSMYLINQVVILFRNIIERTLKVNEQISEYISNISSISTRTSITAMEQMSIVENVLTTIENTRDYASSIETKSNEVINVTESAINDVNKNIKALNDNLQRMNEIIKINKSTISGIENLYLQINGIDEIASLINSVASQTRIIAFNTELEIGNIQDENVDFQNVVKEIRELSDKTMLFTQQISMQIDDIQNASFDLITTGQGCMKKISEGNVLSENLNQKLTNVTDLLKTTSASAFEVNNYIFDQISTLNQIKGFLEKLIPNANIFTESINTISDEINNLEKETEHLKHLDSIYKEK